MMSKQPEKTALMLGTLAFTTGFAIWGLIAGLMPLIKKELALSAQEASILVAVPVILGSLGRIPVGILADKFGGRIVFSILLASLVPPALALGFVHGYWSYIAVAVLLGLGGTTFSVGVSYVSRWFPPEQQGTALGIYGAGNIGQSIAVFGAPALATVIGIPGATAVFAAAAAAYAVYFFVNAKDAPVAKPTGKATAVLADVAKNRMCWVLSLLYFQTFGGFVALSIYMPMLLKELFSLSPTDAGFRTAMFVVLATAARPIGGWLADRFDAAKILAAVLTGLLPCALFMSSHDFGYFTAGALAAAALVGLGNGAVFKLVGQHFRSQAGTATGIVGAAGGMGGFFPPLLLGYCKDHLGSYAPGFYLLAAFAAVCLVVVFFTFLRKPSRISTASAH
jgi:NNP family nitrate/nitrite transporter-like MFS transporter